MSTYDFIDVGRFSLTNKASVVIPVYNGYKWAEGIVKSISGNIDEVGELILINDGDAHDFEKLIKFLRLNLNLPLTIIHTSGRQGPAVARNLGLDKVKCKYIAFLDCDDIWLPGTLKRRVDLLAENPAAPFTYCSWQYFTEQGCPLNAYFLPTTTKLEQLLVTNYLALPSIVISKEYLGEKRFPCIGHEDYGLWLDLLSHSSAHALGLREVGLHVRVVSGSVSSNKMKALAWYFAVQKRFGVPASLRMFFFIGYAINAMLKRKLRFTRPVFMGLDRLASFWLARRNVRIY